MALKGPWFLAISLRVASQTLHLVVFLLVKFETTFPSTSVISPWYEMQILGFSETV